MNPKNDEPAFPCTTGSDGGVMFRGVSKREYFAAMALQGLASNQESLLANHDLLEHFGTDGIDKLQANKAVRLADALLAALKEGE